jgi:hypothetical protein
MEKVRRVRAKFPREWYTRTMKNATADILGALVVVTSTAFAAWWMMAA